MPRYRKVGLTWARELTVEDHFVMDGIIATLEGPVSFEVGDYLCHGAQNDFWPIKAEKFNETKVYVEGQPAPEPGQYAMYTTRGSVQAEQVCEPFETEIGSGEKLKGKAGDYRVRDDHGHEWVVDRDIFETSYAPVRPEGWPLNVWPGR
jgi:hypothetical protein